MYVNVPGDVYVWVPLTPKVCGPTWLMVPLSVGEPSPQLMLPDQSPIVALKFASEKLASSAVKLTPCVSARGLPALAPVIGASATVAVLVGKAVGPAKSVIATTIACVPSSR